MFALFVLMVGLTLVGGGLTRFSLTVDEIKSRFDLAQKYYAAKDYENGVTIFKEIVETPNRVILEVDTITVEIDDLVLPVRIAATYQVGNSLRNVGLDLLARSNSAREEGDSLLAEQRRGEALEALKAAREHFSAIVADAGVPRNVRVMSQYQTVRVTYAMEDFPGVVEEVDQLLRQFPGNPYEEAALYDLGWSYFRMEDYLNSIATFERVLERSADAVRLDRALFQIAEAHSALAAYPEALFWYQKLVDKYDFSTLSAKDLRAMQTAKIRGVVQETTRELVAKAQIKLGDTYALQGREEQAITAYSLVPRRYPQEVFLVEQSYTRLARLILERRGLDEGIRAYEQAIQSSARKEFQATTQLQIARLLFEARRFQKAIMTYRVYLKAYGGVARIVGFTEEKVIFKIAEAHRERGLEMLKEDGGGAQGEFENALAHYDSLLAQYGASPLTPDAKFGKGVCYQGLERPDSALVFFQDLVESHPSHLAVPSALLQIGRLLYQAGAYPGAAVTYERLIAQYPQSELIDDARVELGVVYKAQERLDEAVVILQQVSRDSPNWVKVRVEIGDMLTAAGRYEEAQDELDGAISLAGDDSEAMAALQYIKGKIAYSQKKYAEALPAFGLAIDTAANQQIISSGLFLRGLAHYEVGRRMDAAGDSLAGTRNFERSTQDMRRLLEVDISLQMRNIAYRTLGTAMTRLGRSEATIRYYAELIASTTDVQERVGFELLLLELYYDQRRFEEAIEVGEKLIREDFEDNDEMGYFLVERAYSILASAQLERKRYAEALAAAGVGLSRYPRSGERASMAFVIGLGHYFLQQYAEAVAGFVNYVEQFPRDRRQLEGCYYAAQCYQILGEYGKAATWFRRVLDQFGPSEYASEALFLCAENLYNALQFEAALNTYEELLADFPHSEYADDAMYSSAWALFELKRMEEGVQRMEQLVAGFTRSMHAPRAQFTIGDYYYSIKDYRRAQEGYRKLVDLSPQSPEAGRAGELIIELDEEIASQIYDRAVEHYQRQDYRKAIQLYQEIAAQYPATYTAFAALGNMGVALEDIGEKQQAEQAYKRVIARAGGDPAYGEVVAFARARLGHL